MISSNVSSFAVQCILHQGLNVKVFESDMIYIFLIALVMATEKSLAGNGVVISIITQSNSNPLDRSVRDDKNLNPGYLFWSSGSFLT